MTLLKLDWLSMKSSKTNLDAIDKDKIKNKAIEENKMIFF
jgi:hypothetical protein